MFIKKLLAITHKEIIYKLSLSLLYVIFCFLLIRLLNFILRILEKKSKEKEHYINFALISSLERPMKALVWAFGLYETLQIFNEKFVFLRETKVLFGVTIALWLSFRFISQYTKRVIEIKELKKENIDYGSISFFKKISQIVVFFIVLMFSLGKLGVSLESLMAVGGIGGITIGFAAKDLLSNIFGGLTIYLDKPFTVGDWISSPDREIEGDVEEIGWRQTRIITFAKFPIYVANSVFSNIIVQNRGRMKARRMDEIIPIRYMDISKAEKIVKDIREMLRNHVNINQRLITVASLHNIQVGILNIRVHTFVNTIEWLKYTEVLQDVLIKIVNIVKANGGEIAYDTKEIFVNNRRYEDENRLIVSGEHNDIF